MTSTAEGARTGRAVLAAYDRHAELRQSDVESVTVRYLMYVLLPTWFVPG